MGSADDEQHPETTQQQFSSDNATSTHSNEAPRLTPMPRCLMHWWTPLAIAEGLLRWTLIVAFFWGGQPHWPSSEAMKLCMTITGAGLAFSAWQQRSHDNAANAKQARAAIERDDYWKRREQIFQILGSKNPGLRLGAVELLAELADKAAHSNLLNDSEKQQLQQHIIDTLCLQLRHEGRCRKTEGRQEDHAEIQKAITNTILMRIQTYSKRSAYADWSKQEILFTNCDILIPLKIENIKTDATLNLSQSTLKENLLIQSSTIGQLIWTTARFLGRLDIKGNQADTVITIDGIPNSLPMAQIENAIICTQRTIHLKLGSKNAHDTKSTTLFFRNCTFYDTTCACPPYCSCRINTKSEACACTQKTNCNCLNRCLQHADISISNELSNISKPLHEHSVDLWKCNTGSISLSIQDENTDINLVNNTIHGVADINISSSANQEEAKNSTLHKRANIDISENYFITDIHFPAIRLSNEELPKTTTRIEFQNNTIIDPYDPNSRQQAWAYSRRDHKIYCNIEINTKPNSTSSTTPRTTSSSNNKVTTFGNFRPNHPGYTAVRPALESDQDFIKLYHSDSWPSISANENGGNSVIKPSNQALILNIIKREHVFIIFDYLGPLAIFAFHRDNCERYGTFRGRWRSNATPYAIHCIVDIRGLGVPPRVFTFAAQRTTYLRSDAHIDDLPTQRALEKFGFIKCGTFTENDGTQRIAYDWIKELEHQD